MQCVLVLQHCGVAAKKQKSHLKLCKHISKIVADFSHLSLPHTLKADVAGLG